MMIQRIHAPSFAGIVLWAATVASQGFCASEPSALSLQTQDRILIVAPHPDDEAIAAAGVIEEAVRRHIPVRVMYLTNGDSNQLSFLFYRKHFVLSSKQAVAMGELRQREAQKAMHLLGLTDDQMIFLGYPDYGTLEIFKKFWRPDKAYRGTLTRATGVPYTLSLSPGAPYTGESILADIEKVLADFRPTKIFVNHPADENADHQAAYLFTRVALWDLRATLGDIPLYAYMVHRAGWPRPLGLHPQLRLFPDEHLHLKPEDLVTFDLDDQQLKLKQEAVLSYRSQIPYKPNYLVAFVRANEWFARVADLSLKPQMLDQKAWDALDDGQELKIKNKKIDMRLHTVLRSVVYGLAPDRLVVKIKLNQWSRLGFNISLYVFGYKDGVPFAEIPKYCLQMTDDLKVDVSDGKKKVRLKDVMVSRQGNDIFISVPLAELGYPDRVISSATVRVRNWPEEFSVWTIVRLKDV